MLAGLSLASSREIRLDDTVLPSSGIYVDDSTQLGLTATITVDDSFGLAREAVVNDSHSDNLLVDAIAWRLGIDTDAVIDSPAAS
mgnify:CR=1 FL=1